FLSVAPDARFTDREKHELYCAGHLIEAAVAYAHATGKDALLRAMIRYADYIYQVFYIERSAAFDAGGHPEIELALVRLYDATGERKYLELARHFLDMRGRSERDRPIAPFANMYYDQSHKPLLEQETPEGHAVRALYIYSAMADIASRMDDPAYFQAASRLFEHIVARRMYITGATGSTHIGEAFTVDYHLPNRTAYAETCASIALALFARRMMETRADAVYADTVERVMYNGALAGVSLDGASFFYENPLEIDPAFADVNASTEEKQHMPIMQRKAVFDCSCCPPNIVRFIASIAQSFYTVSEADGTVFVHQYAQSTADLGIGRLTQETDYPADGRITLRIEGGIRRVALRIPLWCRTFTLSVPYKMTDDYVYMDVPESGEIVLDIPMEVQLIEANAAVQNNAWRVAVMRGPVVYCAEGIDNGEKLRSLSLVAGAAFTQEPCELFGLPVLRTRGLRRTGPMGLYARYHREYEEAEITLIPYYAFANRGESEMNVWLHILPSPI
ncbi:MAG: glycoside hydrolase family 127 protein, partial [Clostridia bacterium]|nr:glycoside hydrolase family 127 protein [Clostridia bacterium]